MALEMDEEPGISDEEAAYGEDEQPSSSDEEAGTSATDGEDEVQDLDDSDDDRTKAASQAKATPTRQGRNRQKTRIWHSPG